MDKLPYPVVLVKARDWNIHPDTYCPVEESFDVAVGWAVGFLLEETKEKLVIAFEYFEDSKHVRGVHVYPKETVVMKRVLRGPDE
jgi:hypothetical protein